MKDLTPNVTDCALAFEGGGYREAFSAGVATVLMDAGIRFGYVCGVSAGASNTVDYVSDDKRRVREAFMMHEAAREATGVRSLARGHGYFDADALYEDAVTEGTLPFDFETFQANPAEVRIQAFQRDTGCTLRDPVTGGPVLVLERRALDPLWTPPVRDILAQPLPPEEKMARLHGEGSGRRFTLLPFTAVGTASGLLLAVYSDYIELAGRRHRRALLALSDGPLSDGGGYQALWGGRKERRHGTAAAASAVAERPAG